MRAYKIVSFSVVILLITVVFAGAVPAAAQYDTMQYRYNAAHTGDYSPVAGSVPSNGQLLWNYTITGYEGYVDSSPAVANGVVYVGSYDNNLYALNATTGAKLWNYTTGGSVQSSPAVANGVVYVGSYDNNLYALNATTGTMLWSFTTGGGVYSSPAVANGVVYVGSWDFNGDVYALNATTGAEVWDYMTGSNEGGSPAVANGMVYVGQGSNLYALNATTGAKVWNYGTQAPTSSPAVANGVVYVGTQNSPQRLPTFYALNATTGAQVWSYPTGAPGPSVQSSPAVANGMVYVGGDDGNLYALNATTGTMLWSFTTQALVTSSPAVANGVVYVGSDDNNLYAIGNRTTTLTATAPSTASVNQNFTINGTLSGSTFALAGATLTLQRSTDNVTFTNVSTNVTNTTGGYAFSKNESAAGTYYYRAAYAGNASYNNATSNVVKVSVTAPATTGNLLLNTHLVSTTTGSPPKIVTTYTFSGQLMTTSWTPVANAAITLQSSADKVHWSAFASPVKTNAQGAYTFKGTLKPGSYYFRTFFAGTSSTGPTASRIVRVVLSLNGSSSVSTVVA
jgi:outer membrane protein assembly factor BamB